MIPSINGLLVAASLFFLDRQLRGKLVVGLMASLAFGATSFVTLTAVGGSSPLIYTLFIMGLVIMLVFERRFGTTMVRVLSLHPISWVLLLLMAYVVAGALILPRLFRGEMLVYVATRGEVDLGTVEAAWLAPQGGNISQAAYFVLSALVYFVVAAAALEKGGVRRLTTAMFAWAVFLAALGFIDLFARSSGFGDVLAPIRTASYAMMTSEDHTIAGLVRINGAFSEASTFGASAVPALVFALAYWRIVRRVEVLLLALALSFLVVLSTSSTAYVTVGICAAWLAITFGMRFLLGRIQTADAILLGLGLALLVVLIGAYLYNPRPFQPLFKTFEVMLFDKASSNSALERGIWNAQAMQNFVDSGTLGIGAGSTRTSSWIVAVISQLGAIGSFGIFFALFLLIRGLAGLQLRYEDRHLIALASGCRAAALAAVIANSLTAPAPDPGVIFYVALATVLVVRHRMAKKPTWTAAPVPAAPAGGPSGATASS